MDAQDLLLIAFRATIVYFALLIVIRVLGKREVGSFGAFDLIVSLILGEAVDEAIYGDVTMSKFIVLIVTIAVWELVNSYASYKSKAINKLINSSPSPLVEYGQINRRTLARERMNEADVYSALRAQGVEDINEVKLAMLEPNGSISVIQTEQARPVQKKDLPASQPNVG